MILIGVVVVAAALCLCPQRSGSRSGTLREAAALQPAQVQLLPLRPGSVRQAGSAGGDREDHLHRLRGEGQGEFVHDFTINNKKATVFICECIINSPVV